MPIMDGLEACIQIRRWEEEQGGHMPIVAMTAHCLHGFSVRCREVGMDGYISKPIEPGQLFQTLDSVVSLNTGV